VAEVFSSLDTAVAYHNGEDMDVIFGQASTGSELISSLDDLTLLTIAEQRFNKEQFVIKLSIDEIVDIVFVLRLLF